MYSKDFTDDGYSNVVKTRGGLGGMQVTVTGGSGTVALVYCPSDKDPSVAANFTEYDSDNAVLSANGIVGVRFLEGFYALQLSSGSTPEIRGSLIGREITFQKLDTVPA